MGRATLEPPPRIRLHGPAARPAGALRTRLTPPARGSTLSPSFHCNFRGGPPCVTRLVAPASGPRKAVARHASSPRFSWRCRGSPPPSRRSRPSARRWARARWPEAPLRRSPRPRPRSPAACPIRRTSSASTRATTTSSPTWASSRTTTASSPKRARGSSASRSAAPSGATPCISSSFPRRRTWPASTGGGRSPSGWPGGTGSTRPRPAPSPPRGRPLSGSTRGFTPPKWPTPSTHLFSPGTWPPTNRPRRVASVTT
jgi:hypothetical protein